MQDTLTQDTLTTAANIVRFQDEWSIGPHQSMNQTLKNLLLATVKLLQSTKPEGCLGLTLDYAHRGVDKTGVVAQLFMNRLQCRLDLLSLYSKINEALNEHLRSECSRIGTIDLEIKLTQAYLTLYFLQNVDVNVYPLYSKLLDTVPEDSPIFAEFGERTEEVSNAYLVCLRQCVACINTTTFKQLALLIENIQVYSYSRDPEMRQQAERQATAKAEAEAEILSAIGPDFNELNTNGARLMAGMKTLSDSTYQPIGSLENAIRDRRKDEEFRAAYIAIFFTHPILSRVFLPLLKDAATLELLPNQLKDCLPDKAKNVINAALSRYEALHSRSLLPFLKPGPRKRAAVAALKTYLSNPETDLSEEHVAAFKQDGSRLNALRLGLLQYPPARALLPKELGGKPTPSVAMEGGASACGEAASKSAEGESPFLTAAGLFPVPSGSASGGASSVDETLPVSTP